MAKRFLHRSWLCAAMLTACPAAYSAVESDPPPVTESHALIALAGTDATVGAYRRNGHVVRLYGQAFSNGISPEASAEAFLAANAAAVGLDAADLVPAERGAQPLVWDPATRTFEFTAVYYEQVRDGVPVFRSKLVLLVRNDLGFPLVLANTHTTRAIGAFSVQPHATPDPVPAAVARRYGRSTQILSRRSVIFAGTGDEHVAPKMADEVTVAPDDFDRWLLVVDRATGDVLYEEHLIHFEAAGVANGLTTEGEAGEHCQEEIPLGVPYLQVTGGGDTATTDADGNYALRDAEGLVTVTGSLANGTWFQVFNQHFSLEVATAEATGMAGTPIDLLFNPDNTQEERAQVNGYYYANLVRDFALAQNPAYPGLDHAGDFAVRVNRIDGFCPGNAWYDSTGPSINFCRVGDFSTVPNTSYASVIYHEYGHHLVNAGGSGQGAYGEGMGDTVSLLIHDNSEHSLGWFGSCDVPLRSADNDLQYPCGGAIHFCGQLLSGCVWETRNELVITEPETYREVLASLVVNSILLHTGSGIDPSITIDVLTLDDDNGDLLDGSPHYAEIAAGFGEHGMDAPELTDLIFSFPSGLPDLVAPSGTTTLRFQIDDVVATVDADAVRMMVDTGAGFVETFAAALGDGLFEATFPPSDCGTEVAYYIVAGSTGGEDFVWPEDAPSDVFSVLSAFGVIVGQADDMETDMGWTVVDQSVSSGGWERGVPEPTGFNGAPPVDGDGSGQCWTTGLAFNRDLDGGPSTLTSPILDPGVLDDPVIGYLRWFTNDDDPSDPDRLVVEISNNGGGDWVSLETVDADLGDDQEWVPVRFRIADFVTPTDQLRVRFIVADQPNNSTTEAAIDALAMTSIVCVAIPGDVDGDGAVDFLDLVTLLADWGDCPDPPLACPADFDGNGIVDFLDLVTLLANWTV